MTMPESVKRMRIGPGLALTEHAWSQMGRRKISPALLELTLEFGRSYRARKAEHFLVGRNEIQKARDLGVDLEPCDGMVVVCSPQFGSIITVYRDRSFGRLRHRDRRGTFCRRPNHIDRPSRRSLRWTHPRGPRLDDPDDPDHPDRAA